MNSATVEFLGTDAHEAELSVHVNYKSDSGFSGTKLNCLYSNVDCIMKFKVSLA